MKKAYLRRFPSTEKQTLGIFMFETDKGTMTLGSLELPWKNNEKNISCIPKGTYKVTTTYSEKYKKNMWLINDVPNRSGVRIHSGNFYFDTNGCILLGLSQEDINDDGEIDMVSSRKAISLAKYWLGKEFELTIL